MSSRECTFDSVPTLTLYGDISLQVDSSVDVFLPPASSDHLVARFTGKLPENVRKDHHAGLELSVKSAIAQVGGEKAEHQLRGDVLCISLVNCGPYGLCFLASLKHNLGAIYHVDKNQVTEKDTIKYLACLQENNAHLSEKSFKNIKIHNQHFIWIETSTVLGTPLADPHPNILDVHLIPRGSDREAMQKVTNRQNMALSEAREWNTQLVGGSLPFALLQTASHINPVDGYAYIIQGFATLSKQGELHTVGLHSASRLVAQPATTHENGRPPHPIIAEIHESAEKIIKNGQKGKTGFYGYPVKLNDQTLR